MSSGTRTSLVLAWDASKDDVGVLEYRVFRNGVEVARQSAGTPLNYADPNVKCSSSYTYAVEAVDASGNVSPPAVYTAHCSFH